MKNVMGVYCILNLTNGKKYIGSSVNVKFRINHHKHSLRAGKHYNNYLQRTWDKYKEENFEFLLIEQVEKQENLIEAEKYWISNMKTYLPEKGYNLNFPMGNNFGHYLTDKQKQYLSQLWSGEKALKAKLNWKQVKEIRELYQNGTFIKNMMSMYQVSYGCIQSIVEGRNWVDKTYNFENARKQHIENIKKLPHFNKGRKHSEEVNKQKSIRNSGSRNPMFGKKQKESTKQLISSIHKKNETYNGEKNPNSKLIKEQVKEIRELHKNNLKTRIELAEMFKVSKVTINSILRYATWKEEI